MRRAGFQAAFRYASGTRAGAPAGELLATGDSVQIIRSDSTGVPYAQHTAKGSTLPASGVARWTLEWRAPEQAAGAIAIHVAANAANDDASEFGDFIHTFEVTLQPKD